MIEPPPFHDRELLRRLIRQAFLWAEVPAGHTEASCLHLDEIVRLIKQRATQLPGIAADDLRGLRREVVRSELFELREVRARDPNTADERFCLIERPVAEQTAEARRP